MKSILKLVVICMVAHAVITATLSNIGVNPGTASNFTSILPYLMVFSYWLITIFYRKSFYSSKYLNIMIVFFCLPLFFSFPMATLSFDFIAGFAIIKTYYLFYFMLIIFYDVFRTSDSINEFNIYLKKVLKFVCIFTLVETVIHIILPDLYETYLAFMTPANKNVLEHISVADSAVSLLLEGTRQALQPLGIFFDLQTQGTLAMLLALWSLSERKYKIAFLAIAALVLSMRITQIVGFVWGVLILYFGYFALLVIPILITSIIYLAEEYSGFTIIQEHLSNNIVIIFNSDWFSIFFGRPADQMLEYGSEILGYNEVYIYRYLFYFGLFAGAVLIAFMVAFCYMYSGKENSSFVSSRLGLALGLNIPILVIHYNLLYVTIILFFYIYFFFLGWSSKFNKSIDKCSEIKASG